MKSTLELKWTLENVVLKWQICKLIKLSNILEVAAPEDLYLNSICLCMWPDPLCIFLVILQIPYQTYTSEGLLPLESFSSSGIAQLIATVDVALEYVKKWRVILLLWCTQTDTSRGKLVMGVEGTWRGFCPDILRYLKGSWMKISHLIYLIFFYFPKITKSKKWPRIIL